MTQDIPARIRELLDAHHGGCVESDVCEECSSHCCAHSGFALLDNVQLIYEMYRREELKREGHSFPEGLTMADFVFKYFDVWSMNVGPEDDERELVFFHPKSIDEKGRLISIPARGGYFTNRTEFFDENPWLNHGCVFLDKPYPEGSVSNDDGVKRRCLLHTEDALEKIGPKPLDCLFFTCKKDGSYAVPAGEETDRWFYALAQSFPGSAERLEVISGNYLHERLDDQTEIAMQVVMFEVKQHPNHEHNGVFAGAFVNCYMKARTARKAYMDARNHIEDSGWIVIERFLPEEITEDSFEGEDSGLEYFEQAQIDGEVFVFHTFDDDDE